MCENEFYDELLDEYYDDEPVVREYIVTKTQTITRSWRIESYETDRENVIDDLEYGEAFIIEELVPEYHDAVQYTVTEVYDERNN